MGHRAWDWASRTKHWIRSSWHKSSCEADELGKFAYNGLPICASRGRRTSGPPTYVRIGCFTVKWLSWTWTFGRGRGHVQDACTAKVLSARIPTRTYLLPMWTKQNKGTKTHTHTHNIENTRAILYIRKTRTWFNIVLQMTLVSVYIGHRQSVSWSEDNIVEYSADQRVTWRRPHGFLKQQSL